MTALILIRVALLALTLWGAYILLVKAAYRQNASAFNVAWPSVTGALFAATMGWLT